MTRYRSVRLAGLAAIASCVLLTGCVSETTNGSGSTFKFQWWIPTLITVVALVLIVGGVLFTVRKKQGAWVAILVGVAGMLFGPNLFFDRAVIDNDHFELSTGFFFSPTYFNIKWDNVASIHGSMEEKTGRRGRKSTSFYLNFNLKSGGSEKVPSGDLMKNGPIVKLIDMANAKGIPVTGPTNANLGD
jgi:hypothetical protein